ncbi:MAG: helix-turn-helix domain-containing protein [Hyphomonadaceae bacterium]|nr:helix-turn-helix domain-containing protein [Hyphomonadaceae bacterium]
MITQFFLYGEPPKPAGDRFAHLELLDDRSRPANWIIRPHSHRDLHHVFLLQAGHGRAEADGRSVDFRAPCIVAVPAGVVHGFHFQEDSAGRVLTFSDPMLRLIASRFSEVEIPFERALWAGACEDAQLDAALDLLELELGWAARGHDFAVEALLSTVLVWVSRVHHHAQQESQAPIGPRAMLVARYRALVEERFREHPTITESAGALGVTPSVLRNACRSMAGVSPAEILKERLNLEAQRLMRYSNLSVSQIALQLGFDDPAYFSRFFTRMSGQCPRQFRIKMCQSEVAP